MGMSQKLAKNPAAYAAKPAPATLLDAKKFKRDYLRVKMRAIDLANENL